MKCPDDCDTCCAERYRCAWSAVNEEMENPIITCPIMRDQTGILIAPYPDIGKWRAKLKEVFG